MHGLLDSIICDAHAGFIPGRQFSNNILLAHELIKDYTRNNISPRSMVKVDLQKAYESVERLYLEQVMLELGFPNVFTKWVMSCVKLVSYAIVVNRTTAPTFDIGKRVRLCYCCRWNYCTYF